MLTYCHAFLLKRRFQIYIWQVRYCTARTVKNVSYFLLVTHKMPTWSFLKKTSFIIKRQVLDGEKEQTGIQNAKVSLSVS